MRRSTARALVTVSILPVAAFGSEDKLEEVVVTASFTGITSSKAAPVHILTGDDVTTAGVQSLGEHIDSLLGVSTADFGAAVGHPIIRGMGGTRVKVLNNGTVVRDVSGLGVDHPIDANLSHLQQLMVQALQIQSYLLETLVLRWLQVLKFHSHLAVAMQAKNKPIQLPSMFSNRLLVVSETSSRRTTLLAQRK